MALTPGTRLGSYSISAPIGAGGMGEVYRASDARLGRDVAIKVLPQLFASDPERLARFEREARSVAALSHPNILGIFDFGTDRGITYAVMELLEGETLRERISAGALSPRKATEYAVQIAQALGAAHGKGIAHRDLKPENIFITRDDRVKVLDFGLAKSLDLAGADAGATVANTGGTAAGMVMGTVGYMAPEQLRGQGTDHRADVFAFGAVLYEMLTGQRAFKGETPADTISAILNTEPPDLEAVVAGGVPPALDRIVRRCLEKRPELRFHSSHDLAFALETLAGRGSGAVTGSVPGVAASGPAARSRMTAALPWVVAAVAVAAAGAWIWRTGAAAAPLQWIAFRQITDAAGEEAWPSLSPDGNTVAFAAREGGNWNIYAQRVGGRNRTLVIGDPARDETDPAFSPDGQQIAFHESDVEGGIFVVGATGESLRRVTNAGFHPAWSPDGKQIAFSLEEIVTPYSRQGQNLVMIVDAAGGEPRQLGAEDGAQPSWSPSGQRIVFWANDNGQRDLFSMPAAGGERVPLLTDVALDWCPVWDPDGRSVLFASDRGGSMNLWRIPVDEASGRAQGPPVPVTNGVQAAAECPSLSGDGNRMAFRSRVGSINPLSITLDPSTLKTSPPVTLDSSNNILLPAEFSPDGEMLALHNVGAVQEDIFVTPRGSFRPRRVTDDAARDRGPIWTPDGQSLVFYSTRSGTWGLWAIKADGSGLRQVVSEIDNAISPVMSPDGSRIVFNSPTRRLSYLADVSRDLVVKNIQPLPGQPLKDSYPLLTAWSPDGGKLAGSIILGSGRSSGTVVYELGSGTYRRVSDQPVKWLRWMPDSRRLLHATQTGELVVLDTVSGGRALVAGVQRLSETGYAFALSPDARTLVYGVERSEADIWLADRQ